MSPRRGYAVVMRGAVDITSIRDTPEEAKRAFLRDAHPLWEPENSLRARYFGGDKPDCITVPVLVEREDGVADTPREHTIPT